MQNVWNRNFKHSGAVGRVQACISKIGGSNPAKEKAVLQPLIYAQIMLIIQKLSLYYA